MGCRLCVLWDFGSVPIVSGAFLLVWIINCPLHDLFDVVLLLAVVLSLVLILLLFCFIISGNKRVGSNSKDSWHHWHTAGWSPGKDQKVRLCALFMCFVCGCCLWSCRFAAELRWHLLCFLPVIHLPFSRSNCGTTLFLFLFPCFVCDHP